MPRINNRSSADTEWLKERAREYAIGGLSKSAILDVLNETGQVGDAPIQPRRLREWLLEKMTEGATRDIMHNVSFNDVLYLRGRAFRATADTEINRSNIMERAYWWGLYISALHIILRSALSLEASGELAPQFIVDNIDEWYADLRKLRQLTPRLQVPPEEVDAVEKELSEFEKHYGRDIKLPKETL